MTARERAEQMVSEWTAKPILATNGEERELLVALITVTLADAERGAYEKAAKVCEALSFTPQGPTLEAKHQRNLCANAIRQHAKEMGHER